VDNKMKSDDIMIAYIHKIILYILKYQDTVPEKP
jgi:hypothetical protein